MFLPIGDTPNPRGTPYVNYLLISANIAVFLLISLPLTVARPDLNDPLLVEYLRAIGARGMIPLRTILEQVTAYDLLVFRYGFRPSEPSVVAAFSSMFLHGGWLHLAGNMLFLWIFGDNVEHRLGHLYYLLVYLGSGIAATLFFAAFVPDSPMPLIGASGAISGALGCYFFWFPRNKVKVFIFLFPFIIDTFLIPARIVLGFYLLVDNLIPFLLDHGGGTGVAHGAHIGGFLAGIGVAFFMERLPGIWYIERSRAVYRKSPEVDGAAAEGGIGERIGHLLGENEGDRATRLFETLNSKTARREVGDGDVLAMGDVLLAVGEYDRAISLFRRFAAERPASPLLDRALLGAGKALVHRPRRMTSAYQYFLAALDVATTDELAEEARRYLWAIERLDEQ